MRVGVRYLNCYAGIGGNRALLPAHVDVVAVELNPKVASVYGELYPDDEVVVGDAHAYLLDHGSEFDFIWSSPPCQSHSKMMKATRHKLRRYPDMALYQEILFCQHFIKVPWVVENVVPYYETLVAPTVRVGRHLFWSSHPLEVDDVDRPGDFINLATVAGKQVLMDWLGIHFERNVYLDGNHCPAQILRNAVHPLIGRQVFDQLTGREKE